MKIGYLITARLKSTRLPKKLLLEINGEKIISHIVKRLKTSKIIDDIVICTSTNKQDKPLVNIAEELGVKSYRGSEEDVLKRLYEAAIKFDFDYILNITGDCPLVSIEYIDKIVNCYKRTNADLIRGLDLPHGAYSYGIKIEALKKILEMKQSVETEVWGRYFTDTGRFKVEDLHIEGKHKYPDLRMTLDYPQDYKFFKKIFNYFGDDITTTSLDEILEYLDSNPQIVEINKNCEELYKKRWENQNKLKVSMNILIVGMGSIGTRHLNVLKKIGDHKIYALRSGKGNNYYKEQHKDVINIYDLNELKEKIDRVIISNPTNLHQETLMKCMRLDCPIFVEKPLSNSLDEILDNFNEIEAYKHEIMVGYVLRFHSLFEKLKELIGNNIIGDVILCNMKVGHNLKKWHEYEDYREGYYSQKKLGGGALRTLSHEIDLGLFLFGDPDNVMGKVKKISDLEIDVDDYSLLSLDYNNLIVNIEMNFIDPKLVRKGEIYGNKGKLEYDFVSGEIKITKKTGEVDIIYKCEGNEYNTMYEKQMEYFLKRKKRTKEICNFNTGVKVMKIIDAAEKYCK